MYLKDSVSCPLYSHKTCAQKVV